METKDLLAGFSDGEKTIYSELLMFNHGLDWEEVFICHGGEEYKLAHDIYQASYDGDKGILDTQSFFLDKKWTMIETKSFLIFTCSSNYYETFGPISYESRIRSVWRFKGSDNWT